MIFLHLLRRIEMINYRRIWCSQEEQVPYRKVTSYQYCLNTAFVIGIILLSRLLQEDDPKMIICAQLIVFMLEYKQKYF